MITLLCYEPAGRQLVLKPDDLTRHILGLGSTGSGKTTGLINPILRQLIAWRAHEPGIRNGLLVFDAKEDDTPEKLALYAREAGREKDFVVLSRFSDVHYNFFQGFQHLDQVDEFSQRVLYGTSSMGKENAYWTETRAGLLSSALTLLMASGQPITFGTAVELFNEWFLKRNSTELQKHLAFAARLIEGGQLGETTKRRLQLAVDEARNWMILDHRTRELHKSTLLNALRPLLSPAARPFFDETKGPRFNPKDILEGKVMLVSLNAVAHPQLASLLFRSLKRDFFDAVYSRAGVVPGRDRMVGLVLDEMPLAVTPEDADSLAVIRSSGGFVVGCAQSINAISNSIGYTRCSALLANFNSVFFFGGREVETDAHALLTLGTQPETERTEREIGWGKLQIEQRREPDQLRPICPLGALARLPQHHCYVKLADGSVTPTPVWLAPQFHQFPTRRTKAGTDDLAKAVESLRLEDENAALANASASLFMAYMHRQRHRLLLTPEVVGAAWQLSRPRTSRLRVLAEIGNHITGLDSLPACWLAGLRQWLQMNSSMGPYVTGVTVSHGVLWPTLNRAAANWGSGPFSVPESIALFTYPSLWRPLQRRHLFELIVERPDLRDELLKISERLKKAASSEGRRID